MLEEIIIVNWNCATTLLDLLFNEVCIKDRKKLQNSFKYEHIFLYELENNISSFPLFHLPNSKKQFSTSTALGFQVFQAVYFKLSENNRIERTRS